MKNSLCTLLLVLVCGTLSACSDEESGTAPTLTIEKERIDFKNPAGKKSVAVFTNVEMWDAKADKEWCHPYPKGDQLLIEVDENTERAVREATVTVTGAGQKATLRVRQLGTQAAILIDEATFSVDYLGGKITFNVTTNVEVKAKCPEWITTVPTGRAMVTTEYAYSVKTNATAEVRTGEIEFTEIPEAGSAEPGVEPIKAQVTVTQKRADKYAGGPGDDIKGDIKLKVVSGTASSFQSGGGIELSFDGDYGTIYHSNWNNTGDNYFPITLTYTLENVSDVDCLIYNPRQGGSNNGHFKEVDISYSADGTTFTKLLTKDFRGSGSATKVSFDQTLRARSFRFEVKSGAGDGQGFATCAEMEFFTKNPDSFDYKTLFADELCTRLKAGVTTEMIDKCEYPFFKNLAYHLFLGKYDSEFRVNEFKSYPSPDIQAAINKTSPYSYQENPSGIAVGAGETMIVLVGDTHGYDIGLRVQNLDIVGDGFGGQTYPLNQGLNKLNIKQKGLIYVTYQLPTLNDPNALPVKMHFLSGTINGYFDSRIHAGRWQELLNKATNPHFDVIGEYAHLMFETSKFRQHTGARGEELIQAYDDFVYYEQLLMGLKKYDRMFKNHLALNVVYQEGAYMYATSYHTGYHVGTLSELCNPQSLKTGSCWGPAHEIGHCNQTRPGLKWLGTTEVTNNILSQYIQTTLLKQGSRIQTEDMGSNFRNRYGAAWTRTVGGKTAHAIEGDPFCKLVPFWQLQLYFGNVLGRSPELQADFGGFYPDVFEYVRTQPNLSTPGLQQTEFVYNCSKAAGYNLIDFFTKWGFLTPVRVELDDYGKGVMEVTEARINEIKKRVEALGLPKLPVALEYISDNTCPLYKNPSAVVKGGANRNGRRITMTNWKNVVVYEVVETIGTEKQTLLISSGETTPSTSQWFELQNDWKESYTVYAVGADGSRTEVAL